MFENYKDFLFNNKTLYRPPERFKSYCHVIYTEEVNKTALSSNENKRLKTADKITKYLYGKKKCRIMWNHDGKTIINIKIINFDDCVNEIKMNIIWSYAPDHPYRILLIAGSASGKTNAFLNSTENQPDIDKIYLYVKNPYEGKYQYLIGIREKLGLKRFNDL